MALLGLALPQCLPVASLHLIAPAPAVADSGSVPRFEKSDQGALSGRAGAAASKLDQRPLDLNAYLLELDEWSVAARRLRTHPEEAAALEKDLPRSWLVNIRGQSFSVPTAWLRRTLDSLQSNRSLAARYSKEILDRLGGMRSEVQAFEREPAVKPEAARSKLQEILKRPDFREAHGPTWWERLRERIAYWMEDLVTRIISRFGNHPVAYRGLVWAIAIGLVMGSILWLLRILVRGRPGTRLDLRGTIHVPRTWRDWAREALAASARGDYREAVHLAYWAGIYRLAEVGVWQIDRTRTAREYLRLLQLEPESTGAGKAAGGMSSRPHRAAFADITSSFERVRYGGNTASAADFEAIVAQLEILGCPLQSTPATGRS